eukprot:CAMPEP_0197072796 /NCGR_PEP_ID=MMETSP1384-20130603/210277_1 /TAXON_ID=29189 /ORGANISM="Ammonia sp." /LENGTH=86 /DNA_ID=CAMNT_0042511617 /DNA_START=1356 /DNA_END=1616 /DNA_ORIENTATION=+
MTDGQSSSDVQVAVGSTAHAPSLQALNPVPVPYAAQSATVVHVGVQTISMQEKPMASQVAVSLALQDSCSGLIKNVPINEGIIWTD